MNGGLLFYLLFFIVFEYYSRWNEVGSILNGSIRFNSVTFYLKKKMDNTVFIFNLLAGNVRFIYHKYSCGFSIPINNTVR